MFQDYYRDGARISRQRVRTAVRGCRREAPPGSWQGPIESGFGWHLVFVDTVIPGRAPAFEEIEPDVKQAWLAEQKEKAVKKAYEDMRAKYTVLMPAPPPEGAPPPPKIDPNAAAMRSIPDDVIPTMSGRQKSSRAGSRA